MNNKGFTIVELLMTISLITVLMIMGLVCYSGIKEKSQNKLYSDLISEIYIAGEKYTSDTGEEKVYVKDLVSAGYLSVTSSDGILRNSLGKDLSCFYINTSSSIDNSKSDVALGRVWEETQDCSSYLVYK